MNSAESVNLQSLSILRNELVATIEQAAQDLELFVTGGQDGNPLKACVDGVKQILGILKLLQFRGAALLVEELYIALNSIAGSASGALYEKRLEQITDTFFVLARYLEYIQQSSSKLPVLLVPFINDLRKLRREPVLPESHFFVANLNYVPLLPAFEPMPVSDNDFRPLLSRLRHMYQLGLLGVLRDKQTPAALGLMRRALIRLQRLGGQDQPLTLLWWLSNLAIQALSAQSMELIESRKMLLSRIDRVISQVQKGGRAAFGAVPPKGLVKELIYLLAISGADDETLGSLLRGYGVPPQTLNEGDLARERQALRGPSQQTVNSLSRVLQLELSSAKSILEHASLNGYAIDDLPGLIETLSKIAGILAVVGLVGPSQVLKINLPKVEAWSAAGAQANDQDLEALAKTLLYLESAVASLETTRFNDARLMSSSEAGQKEVVAMSELANAERIVLAESQAALTLTKRAIGAFTESGYDLGHILNISKVLESVWGAMVVLNQPRAAACLQSCMQFIDGVLLKHERPAALQELLETFADALISIEYMLETSPQASRLDESVLQVAEESLAALGYPVQAR